MNMIIYWRSKKKNGEGGRGGARGVRWIISVVLISTEPERETLREKSSWHTGSPICRLQWGTQHSNTNYTLPDNQAPNSLAAPMIKAFSLPVPWEAASCRQTIFPCECLLLSLRVSKWPAGVHIQSCSGMLLWSPKKGRKDPKAPTHWQSFCLLPWSLWSHTTSWSSEKKSEQCCPQCSFATNLTWLKLQKWGHVWNGN